MALQLPRGLFDVGINPLDNAEAPTTLIHNFYPRQVTQTYASSTVDEQGADILLERYQYDERYDLVLETAGLPLAAIAALEGTTVVTAGTGSTVVKSITKNVTANFRPFCQVQVQQKDKSGGATTYLFGKVQATGGPTITAAHGAYLNPTIPLTAFPATTAVTGPPAVAVDDLYSIHQAVTYAALA